MPNSQNHHISRCQISILLFSNFSNHCLANILEPLRAANDLSGRLNYSWKIVTLDGLEVSSSSGLRLGADARLSDAGGDILMVMPSYEFLAHATVTTSRALRAAAKRFTTLAGLDTGSWLLAEAGLLDGHQATIHWDEIDRFSERFFEVHVQKEAVVFDRRRASCGGASTAFEMALQLIGEAHGPTLRMRVENLFMGAYSEQPDPQVGIVPRALQLMRTNLEEPLLISDIAARLGRSQRHLEIQVRAKMGANPQVIYRRMRLALAHSLAVEAQVSVAEIAVRCGYQDASAMTRAFRVEFETTPQAVRRGLGVP
tara:strand:- start:1478 stop:2416 length:939 start_codon:yes stop_codon:yes gene_type:complete